MEKRLTTPFTKDKIKDLKAGDSVLITGTIYTARDAAHERMTTNFKNGIPFPIDLTDNVIYYAGPCPAKPERSYRLLRTDYSRQNGRVHADAFR